MWDLVEDPEDRFSHNEAHLHPLFLHFDVEDRNLVQIAVVHSNHVFVATVYGIFGLTQTSVHHICQWPVKSCLLFALVCLRKNNVVSGLSLASVDEGCVVRNIQRRQGSSDLLYDEFKAREGRGLPDLVLFLNHKLL